MERTDEDVAEGTLFKASFRFIGTDATVISLEPGCVYMVIEKTTGDWWLACNEQGTGQIGYVPGSYLQERLARSTAMAYQYCSSGLNQLVTESISRPPTAESRALIKKMSELRRRIGKWNQEESDESEIDNQRHHKPARPNRTASLPSQRRRRAPPPPPPGTTSSNSKTLHHQSKSVGPMLRSATGSLHRDQGGGDAFDADRIEFITSMSQVTIGNSMSSTEVSEDNMPDDSMTPPPAYQQQQPVIQKITPNDVSVALDELALPDDIGNSLVRCVKSSSKLDAHQSRTVLRAVLSHLGSRLPPLDRLMDKIMTEFLADVKFARDAEAEAALSELFARLESHRDNLHQITNPSSDDLGEITSLLQDILATINETHRDAVLAVVEENNYEKLIILATYYQLETRREIRLGVLKILHYLLGLSVLIARHLVSTVFLVECVQELTTTIDDANYMCSLLDTFTVLLATEETLTTFALDHITQEWLGVLLTLTTDNSTDGKVIDHVVHLMLALNLHYPDSANVVINALSVDIQQWSNIGERIMLHVNRGTDPLTHSQFDFNPTSSKNSVLKFLLDIHATPETCEFLYTSDRNILIEIILRCLLDLDSDSPARQTYLSLLRLILTHSGWRESRHKIDQLTSTLETLAKDEAEFAINSLHDKNRRIAQEILRIIEKCR